MKQVHVVQDNEHSPSGFDAQVNCTAEYLPAGRGYGRIDSRFVKRWPEFITEISFSKTIRDLT